jgi:hypothetical protein
VSERAWVLTRRRVWLLVALVALVAVCAGCSAHGLVLEQPTQIEDLKPSALSRNSLPVTVSWTARPLAPGQRFFVIVDQSPMPPGDSIKDLGDDVCRRTPGCPDKFYLKQHYMFVTRADHVKLDVLPLAGPFPAKDLYDLHKATIVIVDGQGVRIGEEFWSTAFYGPAT